MSDPISEIKEKADIVELISDHIPVKKSGAGYVSICPFHNDTKPSMQISPQKGIFKCFSCGAGGDVFKFYSEFHKKDFSETLKDLPLRYGVQLNYSEDAKAKQKLQGDYLAIYKIAAEYFHDKLLASDDAKACRDYLAARSIDTKTIIDFKLGYSPISKDDWTHLISHIKQKVVTGDKKIFEAGLSIHHEKSGRYYDRFRDRLMVPVASEKGDVFAFGARKLNQEDDSPKYINSPETEFYHKGDNLYGLNLAKSSIRKEDFVIVVEGYFDQIALYRYGIQNVVANQGTALTAKQAKLLLKYTTSKNIYLCLDSDQAGENAKEKAFEQIMKVSPNLNPAIKVIDIPAKDPDEFIQEQGIEAFHNLIKEAKFFIHYKIDKLIAEYLALAKHEQDPRAKSMIVSKIARFLYFIDNRIELAEYVRNLAYKLKIEETVVKEQVFKEMKSLAHELGEHNKFNKANSNKEVKQPPNKSNKVNITKDISYIQDVELFSLLLQDARLLEEFMSEEHSLACQEHFEILDAIVEISFENPDLTCVNAKFKKLSQLELIHEMKYESLLADIAMEIDAGKTNFKSRFIELVKAIKKQKLKSKIAKKINNIKQIENDINSPDEQIAELQNELIMLNKELALLK